MSAFVVAVVVAVVVVFFFVFVVVYATLQVRPIFFRLRFILAWQQLKASFIYGMYSEHCIVHTAYVHIGHCGQRTQRGQCPIKDGRQSKCLCVKTSLQMSDRPIPLRNGRMEILPRILPL